MAEYRKPDEKEGQQNEPLEFLRDRVRATQSGDAENKEREADGPRQEHAVVPEPTGQLSAVAGRGHGRRMPRRSWVAHLATRSGPFTHPRNRRSEARILSGALLAAQQ